MNISALFCLRIWKILKYKEQGNLETSAFRTYSTSLSATSYPIGVSHFFIIFLYGYFQNLQTEIV